MPEDYPRSPPKASFRTRIWHPNVEESTGSVCVDTLKRDWEAKLTLKDVLVVSIFAFLLPWFKLIDLPDDILSSHLPESGLGFELYSWRVAPGGL